MDSSALVAVVLDEADGARYLAAMIAASDLRMSAVNWLETGIVVDHRRKPGASARFDDLCNVLGIEIAPVTPSVAARARAAYRDYGKSNHPARLNLADCVSYALAKETGERLLFKGGDFALTDVEPALDL